MNLRTLNLHLRRSTRVEIVRRKLPVAALLASVLPVLFAVLLPATHAENAPVMESASNMVVDPAPGTVDDAASGFDPITHPDTFARDSSLGTSATIDVQEAFAFIDRDLLNVAVTLGGAYDSNVLLAPEDEISSWVGWVTLATGIRLGGARSGAPGPYLGFDVISDFYAYESPEARAGRDEYEPFFTGFVGVRGAKTDLRADASYRINNANSIDFTDLERETRRTQSNDFDWRLTGRRELPHGRISAGFSWQNRDFDGATGLNDLTAYDGDVAYYYDPGFAPKTSLGIGAAAGSYESEANFDQTYMTPFLALNYQASVKTQLTSRFGYDFRSIDGDGAAGDSGAFSFSVGAVWAATDRSSLNVSAYKDFQPSLVSASENYDRTGVAVGWGYRLPFAKLQLDTTAAYEVADYYSTLEGASAARQDDYLRVGGTLSRPVRLTGQLMGSVSAFFYFNTNDSTLSVNDFDQYFTGAKFSVAY